MWSRDLIMDLRFKISATLITVLCLISVFDGCGSQNGIENHENTREWCKWKDEKYTTVPIQHLDQYNNICLLTCFELSRVKVAELQLNTTSPFILRYGNYTAGCFTVDTAGGNSYHRRAWTTIPYMDNVTNTLFSLTLNLNYTSTDLDNAWTWHWINVTVAVNDSNVTLDVEHRHDITNWAVSLDQYLSCKELEWVDGCNGAEQDSYCNTSVSMKFLKMSAFTSYTRQREMNCDLNKTDQWIAWSLSAAFTLVLIVSASINFAYNTVKARFEQRRNIGYGTI